MGLTQKRAGDRSSFAFSVGFDPDPDAGRGATEEEAASWGSFQIWVDGRNLCAHSEDGQPVDAVYWYMLPLLEWLAEHWDYLLHEEKLPVSPTAPDAATSIVASWFRAPGPGDEQGMYEWQGRHCLLSCRDGGVFPNVAMRRRGDRLEVSCQNDTAPGAPGHVEFFDEKTCRVVEPVEAARALYEVLEDAARSLRSRLPTSKRLTGLHEKVLALRDASSRAPRVALLAGLRKPGQGEADLWEGVLDRIGRARPEAAEAVLAAPGPDDDLVVAGACQACLMFGSVSPAIEEEDAFLLADKLVCHYSASGEAPALKRLVRRAQLGRYETPWRDGYDLAQELLDKMSLPASGDEFVDVGSLLRRLGVRIEPIQLRDKGVRAVAIAGPKHEATVLLNTQHRTNTYATGTRFTLAHELCHLLHDRNQGSSLAHASGPWAPLEVEQRANAFAAMLLMPPSLVQPAVESLRERLETVEGIADFIRPLQVSFTSAVRHLHNLGWLADDAREALLEEAADAKVRRGG